MSDLIWHPFTPLKDAPVPLKVIHGKGAEITLENGKVLIDAISSWWVNIHGHAHPLISKAILDQSLKIEHVIFAGFTHEPAELLARNLTSLLPKSLNRVFFSDNGSTAVEVALKMAVQYYYNLGEKRSAFIAFEGAYHGDTFGAMATASRSVFSEPFDSMLFETHFVPYPETWLGDATVEAREQQIISRIESIFVESPDTFAGVIIEPLVQGAGGMRMCRPVFLQRLEKLCKEHGILLIFDEVMTGFGRTGDYFACLKAESTPDIMCLSKGITGGFLPLAVTVTSEKIQDVFKSDDNRHTFWHGHSYTANPLGCAAANASFEILTSQQKFRKLEIMQAEYESMLLDWEGIEKVRRCGTILAFDLKTESETGYFNSIASDLKRLFPEMGVLLRPLGNVIYVMPPYCITEVQLEKVYTAIKMALSHTQR